MMILDVDGVPYRRPPSTTVRAAEAMKAFDVRDGHGIKLLREAGVEGRACSPRGNRKSSRWRARELGIERVVQGATNKVAGLDRLVAAMGVKDHDLRLPR